MVLVFKLWLNPSTKYQDHLMAITIGLFRSEFIVFRVSINFAENIDPVSVPMRICYFSEILEQYKSKINFK